MAMQYVQSPFSMEIDMLQGCGHTTLTWIGSLDMGKQHRQGHTAWARTYSMDMGMQQGCEHAEYTWACSMGMGMQNGHVHSAWARVCSMDISMQHRVSILRQKIINA
jgi:hypothetical protein